jgi:Fe-S-cluster containining protein
MTIEEANKLSFKLGLQNSVTIKEFKNNHTLEEYYKFLHKLVDDFNIQHNVKKISQCSKQECSFCCHDKIMVSASEMDFIEMIIQRDNIQVNKSIKQTEENWNNLSFKDQACPLLNNGKCTIYQNRPLVCRKYAVKLGTPVENCKPGTTIVEELIIVDLDSIICSDFLINEGNIEVLNFKLTE